MKNGETQTQGQSELRTAELECAFENLQERDLEVLDEALAGKRGDLAIELRDAICAHMAYQRANGYWS